MIKRLGGNVVVPLKLEMLCMALEGRRGRAGGRGLGQERGGFEQWELRGRMLQDGVRSGLVCPSSTEGATSEPP